VLRAPLVLQLDLDRREWRVPAAWFNEVRGR